MAATKNARVLRTLLLLCLGLAALALLVAAVALPRLARSKTREALQGLHGGHGEFADVEVSLVPLRYTLTRLKIFRDGATVREPALYAERVEVTLRAWPLLRGVLAARLDADRVKVVMEQPKPGGDDRLPSLSEVIPVRAVLEHAQLRNSELLYVWVREKGRPSLWVHHVEATLEGLGSRPGLVDAPLEIALRAALGGKGTAWVAVTARPHAERLTFAGEAALDGFDPSQLNAYLAATKDVSLTPGSYSVRVRFRCNEGRLTGVVVPHLRGTELQSAGDLGSALKVLFGKIAMGVSAPTPGTQPSGAIAVSDDLTDPKLQLPPRLEKVVENAVVLGLQESLARNVRGPPGDRATPEPTPLKARK